MLPMFAVFEFVLSVAVILGFMLLIGMCYTFVKLYQKVEQGSALVRNGVGKHKGQFFPGCSCSRWYIARNEWTFPSSVLRYIDMARKA